MRFVVIFILPWQLLTTVSLRGADMDNGNAAKLAGEWMCVSATNDGKAIADDTVQKLRLTLTKEGGYKSELGKQVLFDSTYKINDGKMPNEIDLIGTEGENLGKVAQGIFKLDGDTLTICYTMPGGARPTAFESKSGSAATLVIWKRSKN